MDQLGNLSVKSTPVSYESMFRESATYAELAGLMGPTDKELMEEDSTLSFEALEARLRTPLRPVAKSRVGLF